MSSPSPSVPAPAGEASALNNIEAFLEEALSDLRLDALEQRRVGPGRPHISAGRGRSDSENPHPPRGRHNPPAHRICRRSIQS